MEDVLALFDVDGTLLGGNGVGGRTFLEACSQVIGRALARDAVSFAGATDPVLFRTLCEMHGIADAHAHEQRFRPLYAGLLAERLCPGAVFELPGARALVEALAGLSRVTVGLLTGNYPETCAMKLRCAGLDPARFAVGAFGNDGARRLDLPEVAMARFTGLHGRNIAPQRVVVIGDTPRDVECARHAGCRALAVATGPFTPVELNAAGADLVVDDLRDTAALVRWVARADS